MFICGISLVSLVILLKSGQDFQWGLQSAWLALSIKPVSGHWTRQCLFSVYPDLASQGTRVWYLVTEDERWQEVNLLWQPTSAQACDRAQGSFTFTVQWQSEADRFSQMKNELLRSWSQDSTIQSDCAWWPGQPGRTISFHINFVDILYILMEVWHNWRPIKSHPNNLSLMSIKC